MSYNGWTNYETWATFLWIGNDEGSYLYWREQAEEVFQDACELYASGDGPSYSTCHGQARQDLAARLKEQFEEQAYEAIPDACLMSDLLGAALSEVDWYEVADLLLEDTTAEIDDEDAEDGTRTIQYEDDRTESAKRHE